MQMQMQMQYVKFTNFIIIIFFFGLACSSSISIYQHIPIYDQLKTRNPRDQRPETRDQRPETKGREREDRKEEERGFNKRTFLPPTTHTKNFFFFLFLQYVQYLNMYPETNSPLLNTYIHMYSTLFYFLFLP